jgi:hypothetical protein
VGAVTLFWVAVLQRRAFAMSFGEMGAYEWAFDQPHINWTWYTSPARDAQSTHLACVLHVSGDQISLCFQSQADYAVYRLLICCRSDSYIDPESTYGFQLSASEEHLNDLEPRTIRYGVSTRLFTILPSGAHQQIDVAAILG